MKLLLVAPRLDERVQRLASGAVGAGHEVSLWFASGDPPAGVRADTFRREDPCPTHWMREGSVEGTRALRGVVHELAPDVVHVFGWTGLTSDIVLTAARAGVPSVVELHDHRSTCLLRTRRRPEDGSECTRTYGPYDCVPCASSVHPTPWVTMEKAYMTFGERAGALGRELALARARLIPSEQHGEELVRHLGHGVGPLFVLPPESAEREFFEGLYTRVAEAGAPSEDETGTEQWFEERMRAAEEGLWDEGFAAGG